MASPERIRWIDHARAIGIILVVLGHAYALPKSALDFIHRFNMPLFFFLAGAVIKPERLSEGLIPWSTRRARSLLVPYGCFWLVSTVWWLMIRGIGEKAAESSGKAWWSPVEGLLWGTGDALFVNPPLWFLPAIFVTMIGFWIVWKLTRGSIGGLACAGCVSFGVTAFGPLAGPHGGWWSVDLLPWSIACVVWGFVWKSLRLSALKEFPRPVAGWGIGLVVLPVLAWVTGRSQLVSWNGRLFGSPAPLALMSGLCWVGFISVLTRLIPRSAIMSRLARDSIIILALHGLGFSLLTGVLAMVFHRSEWRFTGGWLAALTYTVASIALCLAVAPLLRRWVPWAVGAVKN